MDILILIIITSGIILIMTLLNKALIKKFINVGGVLSIIMTYALIISSACTIFYQTYFLFTVHDEMKNTGLDTVNKLMEGYWYLPINVMVIITMVVYGIFHTMYIPYAYKEKKNK